MYCKNDLSYNYEKHSRYINKNNNTKEWRDNWIKTDITNSQSFVRPK